MRIAIAIVAVVAGLQASPALSYENFVPLGHNYAPDEPELPAFNSSRDRLNSQVDIYETEIWTRQRNAKAFNSDLRRFSSEQEFKGSSDFIDY